MKPAKMISIEPYANLSRADLRLAELSDADLHGAELSGAILRGADLSGADLRGAILRDAELSDANLSRAELSGADLRGAILGYAILRGADLSGADLRGAILRDADLRDADLRGAAGYICMGWDSRGYHFRAVQHGDTWMVSAGCRWFTFDDAIQHWTEAKNSDALARLLIVKARMIPDLTPGELRAPR